MLTINHERSLCSNVLCVCMALLRCVALFSRAPLSMGPFLFNSQPLITKKSIWRHNPSGTYWTQWPSKRLGPLFSPQVPLHCTFIATSPASPLMQDLQPGIDSLPKRRLTHFFLFDFQIQIPRRDKEGSARLLLMAKCLFLKREKSSLHPSKREREWQQK